MIRTRRTQAIRWLLGGAVCLLAAPAMLAFGGCDGDKGGATLRVFVADSLSGPFKDLKKVYEQENPGVELQVIASGSVLAARKLSQLNDQADLLAVADYMVIDNHLRPKYADWYVCFATNEIVIAYSDASQGAAELTADNWPEILGREGVNVGAANPLHDPCGYWTELVWKLADLHYPASAGGGTIHARMTAKCGPAKDRRSDTQKLFGLVGAAGGIDYTFVYRSQALRGNISHLTLPPQISMGDVDHALFYRKASIELPGRGKDETVTKRGEAIVFALTIPKTVKDKNVPAAEKFVAFLLGTRGREILEKAHVTMADEAWTYDLPNVPEPLRAALKTRARAAQPAEGADGS